MNPFAPADSSTTAAPDATTTLDLTPANVGRMGPDEWARTFMPSVVGEPTATDAPADAASAEPVADDTTPARDASGKFMAKETAPAEHTPDAPPDTTPAPDPEPAAPVVLPFAAVGADGAPVDPATLAAMQVTLKANGQELTLPLADVVRQAQSAAGATRQANELRTTMQQRDADVAAAREEIALLEQTIIQALTDDAAREALAATYRQYTAPEAELARLKQQQESERRDADDRRAREQFESTAADTTRTLASAMEQLITKFPSVTPEELLGRFHLDTATLAVHGVIPPERYADVTAYVQGPLAAYAQQRHERVATVQAEAERAKQAAAQAAVDAKRSMAAAVKPTGHSGSAAAPSTEKPPIKSLKDASAYALSAFAPS